MKIKIVLKVSVLLVCLSIFTIKGIGFVTLNDIECVFTEGTQKSQVRESMIKGSAQFLLSFSKANQLLSLYEDSAISGIFDKEKALSLIKEVKDTLDLSNKHYLNALSIGKEIGYIPEKINRFQEYKYDSIIASNNMNPIIVSSLQQYFESGDILGIYQHNINHINKIQTTMTNALDELNSMEGAVRPNVSRYWEILQLYSEAALFGNYATIIGTEVLNHCGD